MFQTVNDFYYKYKDLVRCEVSTESPESELVARQQKLVWQLWFASNSLQLRSRRLVLSRCGEPRPLFLVMRLL